MINTSQTEPFTAERSTVAEVYDVILQDLTEASNLLPEDNGNYANRYAALAYLAKVYFQMNDFAAAHEHAEAVIQSGKYTFSDQLLNRFGTSISPEAIFTTISTSNEDNRAQLFKDMYNSTGDLIPVLKTHPNYTTALAKSPGDARAGWLKPITFGGVDGFAFTKYNFDYMNVVQASLSEMMLISAECKAELGADLTPAISYLNQIKTRAGVLNITPGASAGFVIQEARNERRLEFVTEGIRVHDLKRRGVLGESIVIRGAPWNCNGMVLQFPVSEITIEGFELNPEGGCL